MVQYANRAELDLAIKLAKTIANDLSYARSVGALVDEEAIHKAIRRLDKVSRKLDKTLWAHL